MYTRRLTEAARWLAVAITLATIVVVYRYCFPVNHTTVAHLLMLVNRRKVDLRYAVAAFIGATLLFNFFFLSSVDTLTIADTQKFSVGSSGS